MRGVWRIDEADDGPPLFFRADDMSRIVLCLEYDGTPYAGWQRQPDVPTVQDAVESAIGRFLAVPGRVEVVAAGRTDTGVHALGQIVHFDTTIDRSSFAWVRGLNALLPPTIAVRWAREVDPAFHARFSACRRSYRYRIYHHTVRAPLVHGRAAWVYRRLDVDAMARAAQVIVGEHDFSSFRASQCQAKNPVKHVEVARIEVSGPWIEFSVSANAFLHHMVRNLVGALLEIGSGRRPPSWMADLLAARDRTQGAPTAPACGLYFTRVEYPPPFEFQEDFVESIWAVRESRSVV